MDAGCVPHVCSDPMAVAPSGTRVKARKYKEKALNEERVILKASCPVETHGDVEHQIKKERIQGMRSHVAKIDIDAIIAQVSALRDYKDVLIGSLWRQAYNAYIVHLLGQLPGLSKKHSHGGGENVGNVSVVGDDFGEDGGGKSGMMSGIGSGDDSNN